MACAAKFGAVLALASAAVAAPIPEQSSTGWGGKSLLPGGGGGGGGGGLPIARSPAPAAPAGSYAGPGGGGGGSPIALSPAPAAPAGSYAGPFTPPWNDEPENIQDWGAWCAFEQREGCYACQNTAGAGKYCTEMCADMGCPGFQPPSGFQCRTPTGGREYNFFETPDAKNPKARELFDAIILYLKDFAAAMDNEPQCLLDSTTDEHGACLAQSAKLRKEINKVVRHPDKAFKCFDPTLASIVDAKHSQGGRKLQVPVLVPSALNSKFRGVSPNEKRATWPKRRTLRDYWATRGGLAGDDFGTPSTKEYKAVVDALEATYSREFDAGYSTIDQANTNPSFLLTASQKAKNFEKVWYNAPWVPLYAGQKMDKKHAPSESRGRFRGSYLYAELMGPYTGMIGIKQWGSSKFTGSVGMTYQGANSIYQEHHHNTPEFYFNLQNEKEFGGNVQAWNIPLDDMGDSTTNSKATPSQKLKKLYIGNNRSHRFDIGKQAAMVAAWARVGQATEACVHWQADGHCHSTMH